MLSFAANYTLSANKAAYPVKITNIYIHILIGFGIFLLTLELMKRLPENFFVRRENKYIKLIAFTTTFVWLFHPLFISTVLYSIQRMAMLSTMFIIYGCYGYIRLRNASLHHSTSLLPILFWIISVTIIGFLCKENGILLPGFLLLIEVYCFRFEFLPNTSRNRIHLLQLGLIIPVVFVVAYLMITYFGHTGEGTHNYYFTYSERLLTELRILWRYAGWLAFLNPEPMGIYHDNLVISHSLIQPLSTLFAFLAWLVIFILILMYQKTRHVFLFCMLWFLWGQIMESTVLPLSLMFEHRNYLPGYGIILGLTLLLSGFLYSSEINRVVKYATFLVLFYFIPVYTYCERVADWSDEKSLIISLMKKQPDSPQTVIMAARFLNDSGDYENSLAAIRYAQKLNPIEPALIFAEAAVQCDNFPNQPFNSDIVKKIQNLVIKYQGTVNTVSQFRQMVQVCKPSTVNFGVLLDLYRKLKSSNNQKLSYIATYGYGYIQLKGGNYQAAIDAWEYVIEHDKNAAVLKPQVEEVRKLMAKP